MDRRSAFYLPVADALAQTMASDNREALSWSGESKCAATAWASGTTACGSGGERPAPPGQEAEVGQRAAEQSQTGGFGCFRPILDLGLATVEQLVVGDGSQLPRPASAGASIQAWLGSWSGGASLSGDFLDAILCRDRCAESCKGEFQRAGGIDRWCL